MSNRKTKNPVIEIMVKPEHYFNEVYPYDEGVIKRYVILGMYQETVNTRKLNPLDPAQIRSVALYFNTREEARAVFNKIYDEHKGKIFYLDLKYIPMGINAAFWQTLEKL